MESVDAIFTKLLFSLESLILSDFDVVISVGLVVVDGVVAGFDLWLLPSRKSLCILFAYFFKNLL